VTGLTVIPTTGNLFSSHGDGYVRFWRVKTGFQVCKFAAFSKRGKKQNRHQINDIAHNTAGSATQLITAGADGVVRVWNY